MARYDSDGDVIMRDPPMTFDWELASTFSRISLVDPPVYRLSNDLLYQLFATTLAGEPYERVIRLSHVCSTWRFIMLHAPLFWTSVTIYIPSNIDHANITEQLLRRSQHQPFDLTVHLSKRSPPDYPIFATLGPHAHRLRKLRILAPTLQALGSLPLLNFPALEQREIFVQCQTRGGSLAVVATPPNQQPSSLQITAFSFSYFDGLKLPELFILIESMRHSLEHFKLYYQTGPDVLSLQHWNLMYGPVVQLPLLSTLQVGFNDALSLVPFMKRLRLPVLQSLSIHDFGMCPEQDTPQQGVISAGFASLHDNPPLHELLSTILEAIPSPTLLKALRLTGLYVPPEEPEDIIEYLFSICGPHIRTLRLVECDAVFLEALAETLFQNHSPWRLERLIVRGMDNDDLLECLWIRHAHEYPKLKELSLEPYTRPPPKEVLAQFAEVVNGPID
ncbi:F-box domain-containing protein [Mycena indigotica]|uniref:F-box domain-containing protein n=1 Tax=Mycena indigotica TaxID=2126181 RepID=A0A8H6S3E5_9AGAR|nr:F-box domain-containing protein [Mycena indigotica]KAF7290590.1 F-box domain-containing protein [Mycena indigotica]